MGRGIIVCGMNGAGKSTFGYALAEKLGYHFIDIENLYFPKKKLPYPYDFARTDEEVGILLRDEINMHENFVLVAVKCDYGKDICSLFCCAVLIDVAKEIRLKRVKQRSYEKFGNRMLNDGDLYEKEERFFEYVKSRDDNSARRWVEELSCPILIIDGTKAVEDNLLYVINRISKIN